MQRRKPTYFRNAIDLRDRVQVRILRRRSKMSEGELTGIVRKAGNSYGNRQGSRSTAPRIRDGAGRLHMLAPRNTTMGN